MDLELGTSLVSCVVCGFGIAWGVWSLAAAVTFMVTLFNGGRNIKNM